MLIWVAAPTKTSAAAVPPEDTDYVLVDDYWDMEDTGPGGILFAVGPLSYGHGYDDGRLGFIWDYTGAPTWCSEVDRRWARFVQPKYGVWDLGSSFSRVVVFLQQDQGPFPAEALEYKIWGSNDFNKSNPGAATWTAADLDTVYRKGWSSVGEDQFETCNDDYVAVWDWRSGAGTGDSYRFIKLQSIWASPYDGPEVDAVKGVLPTYTPPGAGEWQQNIVERGGVFSYTSLAIGYDGKVHIAYGGEQLYYSLWDGCTWQEKEIESGGVGEYCSLALDSMGNPAISYYDATNGALKYTHWNGTGWNIETVDNDGDVGRYTSLAFDSLDNPAISYYDATNDDLKYARLNGSRWIGADASSSVPDTVDSDDWVGSYTSLVFDGLDNPAISYHDSSNGDLKYAQWTCCDWDIKTVDSDGWVGAYTSLALDNSGNPAISYYDATNGALKYAWRCSPTCGWLIKEVDSAGDVGTYTSLAFDKGSPANPAISYYDVTKGALKYAQLSGDSWDVKTVDDLDDVGRYTSLAFDRLGNPGISYYDATQDYLKYAHSGVGGFLGTRTAGTNNYGADAVVYCKFMASGTGPVNLIGVYSRANGGVKVALYTHDSTNDKPDRKIVSNDMNNACTMNQWNYISIPETTLSGGTTYWIGFISSMTGVTSHSSGSGRCAYKGQTYSGFSFPYQAGTGFTYANSIIGAVCAGKEFTIAAAGAVTGWDIETLYSVSDVGRYTSLAFDNSGNPAISYYDVRHGSLKYGHWEDESWDIETVDNDGDVGRYTSLAFDSTDSPGISYYDATKGDLKYAHWNGTGWDIKPPVDSAGDVGSYTSLAFDSTDNPAISYYDVTNGALKYAHWNGTSWDIETVDSEGNVGQYTCLAFDKASPANPAISYYDATKDNLKYAHWNGTRWVIETVDSIGWVGTYTSLAFDSTDNPAISYHDATNGDLKYAHWDGTSWDIETVDSEDWVGSYASLAFDSLDNPAISYYDNTKSDLKYAHWDGTGWDIVTLDTDGFAGRYTSLAFDSSDLPAISYDEATHGHLIYAHLLNAPPFEPSNISPADEDTDVSLTPTLSSSEFDDPDEGDTHAASQWQIRSSTGNYSSPVFEKTDTSNLTQITIPSETLSYDTTYYWRVRHEDNHDNWSGYSSETSFTTQSAPNQPPNQPSNLSPADGATDVSLTFTLQSSAFSDPDGDSHTASQWQIATDSQFTNMVYNPGVDTSNLIQIDITSPNHNATYYWRVRHQDNRGGWSEWSVGTSFTTEGSSGLFSSSMIWIFLVVIVLVAGAAIIGWWFLSKSSRKKPAQKAANRPTSPYH